MQDLCTKAFAYLLSSLQSAKCEEKPTMKISVVILLVASATTSNGFSVPSSSNAEMKADLLQRIQKLRSLKERDGDFTIDFGVKGGEIGVYKTHVQFSNDIYSKCGIFVTKISCFVSFLCSHSYYVTFTTGYAER